MHGKGGLSAGSMVGTLMEHKELCKMQLMPGMDSL
jgi:hypothetical protein